MKLLPREPVEQTACIRSIARDDDNLVLIFSVRAYAILPRQDFVLKLDLQVCSLVHENAYSFGS